MSPNHQSSNTMYIYSESGKNDLPHFMQ